VLIKCVGLQLRVCVAALLPSTLRCTHTHPARPLPPRFSFPAASRGLGDPPQSAMIALPLAPQDWLFCGRESCFDRQCLHMFHSNAACSELTQQEMNGPGERGCCREVGSSLSLLEKSAPPFRPPEEVLVPTPDEHCGCPRMFSVRGTDNGPDLGFQALPQPHTMEHPETRRA